MSKLALHWRSLVLLSFIVAGAVLFGGAAAQNVDPQHVHEAVHAWSVEHPGATVPVIVRAEPGSDAAALAITAGGHVRTDLRLINAVAADVPADRIDALGSTGGVEWISLDSPVYSTANPSSNNTVTTDVFPQEIHADTLTRGGNSGQGIGVAVIDTGIFLSNDFSGSTSSRIVATYSKDSTTGDGYGHGTHIAGLVGGNGTNSTKYIGVAPKANLIAVKVGSTDGSALMSDVVNGLNWVDTNRSTFNIKVVNLSLSSSTAQSYKTDPLDAAVEVLIFHKVLVVVSAGNLGTATGSVTYSPGNDPFVLTVGAVDDKTTTSYTDDVVPTWSSRGTTQDGFAKPDVYAPGANLIAVLSPNSTLATQNAANVVGTSYLRLSGTSMAAGVASGAAAQMFFAHPAWTPAMPEGRESAATHTQATPPDTRASTLASAVTPSIAAE